MRLDLHLHSTASDGFCSPREVVERAVAGRLDVVALSDHDTVAGVEPAQRAVGRRPLQVIPAIEVSSTWTHGGQEEDVHILGYFVDPEAEELLAHQREAARSREERLREMTRRLARIEGIEVPFEKVLQVAGADHSSLGRPHLARTLVEEGHVGSVREAFDRYIGNEHPSFLPTRLMDPREAVSLILRVDGIPVWAHPPSFLLDPLLPQLVEAGVQGLEVYRPFNRPDQVRRLEGLSRVHGLVATGGSDWHGHEDSPSLGEFFVTAGEVAGLLDLGGL